MQQIFAIIVFSFLIISLLMTFAYAVINRRRVLSNQKKTDENEGPIVNE